MLQATKTGHRIQHWEEKQETQGGRGGRVFGLGWLGAGSVPERALPTVMRVKRSRVLSVPGSRQPLEAGAVGGLHWEPREAGGWESKGWV